MLPLFLFYSFRLIFRWRIPSDCSNKSKLKFLTTSDFRIWFCRVLTLRQLGFYWFTIFVQCSSSSIQKMFSNDHYFTGYIANISHIRKNRRTVHNSSRASWLKKTCALHQNTYESGSGETKIEKEFVLNHPNDQVK